MKPSMGVARAGTGSRNRRSDVEKPGRHSAAGKGTIGLYGVTGQYLLVKSTEFHFRVCLTTPMPKEENVALKCWVMNEG
jgi:hypothetical protein